MWINYLKLTLRRFSRQKRYALLNMAGLSVGLAAVLVLMLYIGGQLSYDDFHGAADEVYRVTYEVIDEEQANHYAMAVPALGPALSDDFPVVTHSVRLSDAEVHVSSGTEWHQEEEFLFADSTFFQVFGFELAEGDPSSVLSRPRTVVLTREMAEKYFGDRDPIGQTLQLDFRGERPLEVTGIVENPPPNTHLSFDFLASYPTLTSAVPWFDADNWLLRGSYTYVRLQPEAEASRLEAQLPSFVERHLAQVDRPTSHEFRLHLQPVTDIHLHSHLRGEITPNGNAAYVYILGAVALLILLISGFNYINLATARAVDRAKEVGVRASVGASPRTLMGQFLGGAVLWVTVCGLAAVGLAWLFMPVIESLLGQSYFPGLPGSIGFWSLYGLGLALLGLLAGTYPAFYLSSLSPVDVLAGDAVPVSAGLTLRKALVIAEFALAIVLIAGTIIAYQQLTYVHEVDLGFTKDQLLTLPYENGLQQHRPETVKREFEQVGGVERASIASHVPTMGTPMNNQIRPVGGLHDQPIPVTSYRIDEDFLPVLGVTLAEGRNFSPEIASDSSHFIINRAAARLFGWSSSIGRQLERPNPDGSNERGRVVGLIEDLHFRSLHHAIEPLVLEFSPAAPRFVVLRLEETDMSTVLTGLENRWNTLAPDRPFSYTVLSDHYAVLYREESRLADMVTLFSGLAIVIACLGLYGLAAYSTRRRTKEIGIRKVLGATVVGITALLLKDFLKLAGIGFVLAIPLAYLGARQWLENFAYRIEVGSTVFLLTGIVVLVSAFLAVGYQAITAALRDPAESLRYE